jgi:hypothetical protein
VCDGSSSEDDVEEMMNLRSKLAYMALGGLLVLGGHVLPGLIVSQATAQGGLQDAEFNEVTVRQLTVVDDDTEKAEIVLASGILGGVWLLHPDGKPAASILSFEAGGSIGVYAADGTEVATVMALEGGRGVVSVGQADGTKTAAMLAGEDGGVMLVNRPDGTAVAYIGKGEDFDGVSVYGSDGAKAVSMQAREVGGHVHAYKPDGAVGASIGATEHGGSVTLAQSNGIPGLSMMGSDLTGDTGGTVRVYGPGEDLREVLVAPAVSIGLDERGGALRISSKGSRKGTVTLGTLNGDGYIALIKGDSMRLP